MNVLIFAQSLDNVEKARLYLFERRLNVPYTKIIRSVKEMDEELKQPWDLILTEEVYRGKFNFGKAQIIFVDELYNEISTGCV